MSKTQIVTGGIADDAVSEEHLDATAITGSTELAATPADTDEILISDAGTLKRIDFSHIKSVAGTIAFAARKNANQELSDNSFTKVTFQDEAFDTDSAFADSKFTVPSGKAGKYYFNTQLYWIPNSNTINTFIIHYYINGSTPSETSNYGFSFTTV